MKPRILALLLFLSAFAVSAHAAILFEPYGGYSVGTLGTTTTAGVSDSASVNGFGYGGRAGFVLHHFVIVSGEYQAITAKEKFNSATTQIDVSQSTMFATIGFQAPRGFRLMGSYGWSTQADMKTTPEPTHYKGTAAKLLVGWHMPTTMAVNVEYTIYKYTDSTLAGVTSKIADSYSKHDYSAVMATISFPFEFGMGGGGRSHSSSGSGHH